MEAAILFLIHSKKYHSIGGEARPKIEPDIVCIKINLFNIFCLKMKIFTL